MFTEGYPQDRKITRVGMLWLLAAQLLVLLPLLFYLPVWLIPVIVFSAGWSISVMQGRFEQPGAKVKAILGAVGIGGLMLTMEWSFSLDMMASLLVLGFVYKLLEINLQRDGMVIILTGFLLIAVHFLYSQSMFVALYGFISLLVLTGSMIGIHQPNDPLMIGVEYEHALPDLKLATAMLLLCLPLMTMLFIFVPRFEPFWSIAVPGKHAETGISDQMTPGDIASLSQSDELAFRVEFDGERPSQNDLYWRGLVLQHFNGRGWRQFDKVLDAKLVRSRIRMPQKKLALNMKRIGVALDYDVIYEKSSQPWLFALSPVTSILGDAIYGSDYRIMAKHNLLQPLRLKLTSYPESTRGLALSRVTNNANLQLPSKGNEQSRELAKEIYASSNSASDYIKKILNRYKDQAFYYTLHPPLLSNDNTIDDFLFASRRGFCAHYAGSFVFLMRAAGIPARVVVGYQGGEWNESGNYLAVHQFDAHAWAEVWLQNQGWVRVDPTAAIAPNRIEENLESAMSEEGSFLDSKLFSTAKFKWLDGIRKQIDSNQYAWRKFVLGYDGEARSSLLDQLVGKASVVKSAIIAAAIFTGVIIMWSVILGVGRKYNNEATQHQLYRRFCSVLEKHGVLKEPWQTPTEFGYLAIAKLPGAEMEISEFTQAYLEICYAGNASDNQSHIIGRMQDLLKIISKYSCVSTPNIVEATQ